MTDTLTTEQEAALLEAYAHPNRELLNETLPYGLEYYDEQKGTYFLRASGLVLARAIIDRNAARAAMGPLGTPPLPGDNQ